MLEEEGGGGGAPLSAAGCGLWGDKPAAAQCHAHRVSECTAHWDWHLGGAPPCLSLVARRHAANLVVVVRGRTRKKKRGLVWDAGSGQSCICQMRC